MVKDYRIITNNDVVKIIMKDTIIKLTLLDRQGGDVRSKLLKEVFTSKVIEEYDTPQFGIEPDFHEIVDFFHHDGMVIWGVKDEVNISLPDEEPEYFEEVQWYFDKEV